MSGIGSEVRRQVRHIALGHGVIPLSLFDIVLGFGDEFEHVNDDTDEHSEVHDEESDGDISLGVQEPIRKGEAEGLRLGTIGVTVRFPVFSGSGIGESLVCEVYGLEFFCISSFVRVVELGEGSVGCLDRGDVCGCLDVEDFEGVEYLCGCKGIVHFGTDESVGDSRSYDGEDQGHELLGFEGCRGNDGLVCIVCGNFVDLVDCLDSSDE